MKKINTYTIIDVQSNEIVFEGADLDELRIFVNDLYWNDDVDFIDASFEEVYQAIVGCDYDLCEKS